MKKILKKVKWHHPVLASILIVVILVLVVFFGRRYAFNQIGANIYLNAIPVSGLSYDSASEIIEEAFNQYLEDQIEVVVNGEVYSFSAQDLGIEFDTIQTLENIYLHDYGENFFAGAKSQVYRLFSEIEIKPSIHTDLAKFTNTIQDRVEDLKNPQNASVVVNEDNTFTATSHSNGLNASYEEAYNSIIEQALDMEAMSVTLDTQVAYADVTDIQASEAALLANSYTSKTIELLYSSDYWSKSYSLQIQNDWLEFAENGAGITVEVNNDKLQKYLKDEIAAELNQDSQDAKIMALPENGSSYATVEGIAIDGRALDVETTADYIISAIQEDSTSVNLVVENIEGQVINETGQDLGDLTHLATGASNWDGSPEGRDFNIRKGLSEKVNNILIAPGEEYNFNQNLGPVTHSAGWKDSLAIFGGKNLIPVPGGGLCQVSTTVYRAVVNAGLDVTERSNHSLYVHYYKEYGDGLDAAIYPGSKNLKFVNDTGNYILIQAYDDGYDGFVKIYGTPDGRQTDLTGPFYPKDIPDEWQDKIHLNYNQIGWWYVISDEEGNILEEKQLTGTYRSIPY